MSTLNVSALKNGASATNNIALNTDGTATLAVISSGTAPSITTTGALWLDTSTPSAPILKVYNGVASAWITPPGGSVPPSPFPPASPVTGDIYYDTSTTPGVLKVYNGTAFVPVSTTPGGGTAPASPQTGTTWYNTAATPPVLYVWNGTAWVPAGNPPASGTAPTSPSTGTTWYDTSVTPAVLKVWNGSDWVASGGTQSTSAPTSPSTGQQWTDTSTNPPVLKLWNGSAWIPATVAISNGVAPTSPVTGQLWSDTSTNPATLKAWDGAAWVPVQAAGGGGAGTVTSVSGTLPITVATGTTTPVIAINAASDTAAGAIEIATLAEAATGTSALLASTPSTAVPKTPANMTGAALIPGGNDAARPGTTVTGMFRYNSQAGTPVTLEYYDGAAWSQVGSKAGFGLNLTGSNLKVSIASASAAPAVGTGLTQAITGSLYWDDVIGALFYRYDNGGNPIWVQAVPSGGGGASDWTRTGTVIAPTVSGDTVEISAGTAALPGLAFVGDAETGIYSPAAYQLAVTTDGVEAYRTDASQRLLIGKTVADGPALLQLKGGYNILKGFTRRPPMHQGPLFTKTGAGTLSIVADAALNGYFYNVATAVTMPALSNNTDYAIWQHPDTGALVADSSFVTAPGATPGGTIVGGFHYIPAGRPTGFNNASPTGAAEILEYSIWDLSWRPNCPDPRGMTCILGGYWMDMYICGTTAYAGTTFSVVPSSRFGVTIADGTTPPLIPTQFGGNGATAYTDGKWYTFTEVATSFGKSLPSYGRYSEAAFGVLEATSVGADPGTVTWTQVSKFGLAQAAGSMSLWGSDTATTLQPTAFTAGTETNGRGQVYGAETRAVRLAGSWGAGSNSGSRFALWDTTPWFSSNSGGARFSAEHLVIG